MRQRRRHARGLKCLRLDVLAIAAHGPAEPIGTLLTRSRPTTNQLSPARSRRLRRANTSERWVALRHAERRRFDRAPLMRFVPLQRLPVRDALCGAAMLRTIPLRRFLLTARPARPRTFERQSRPCGFSLCEYDAAELEVRTYRLRFREAIAASPRRLNLALASFSVTSVDRSCPRLASAHPSAVTLSNDPSHQAPPLRLFAGSKRSCIAA